MSELSKPVTQNKKETDTLERIVELSLFYDFYGTLLKEQKREIFEDYVLNDLSLSEIAEERGMSRQGVHDSIRRCSKELAGYEEKLGLIRKFNRIKEKIGKIHETADSLKEAYHLKIGDGADGFDQLLKEGTAKKLEQITRLSDEILEEL